MDVISILLIATGCFFFIAGSIGMIRLPDAFARLHATTKADNVGLGLVVIGLLLQADSFFVAAKLILIWLNQRRRNRQLAVVGFGVVVAVIVGVLGSAILTLPTEATGLHADVEENIEQAGAENPVTAVLLNFRGYDTLLEVTVLLLAVLGARALAAAASSEEAERTGTPDNPVLLGFIRVVAPVMIVVAGYLLWVGGHAPGGAFQAGAVLAALGVLLQLGGVNWTQHLSAHGERLLLTAGLAVFLAIGVGTMSGERHFLEYLPLAAKSLILVIEAFATVSIAAILLALFCGGTFRDAGQSHESRRRGGE